MSSNKLKHGDRCFVVFKDANWAPHEFTIRQFASIREIIYKKIYSAVIVEDNVCCVEVLLDEFPGEPVQVKHTSISLKPLSIKQLVQSLVTRE